MASFGVSRRSGMRARRPAATIDIAIFIRMENRPCRTFLSAQKASPVFAKVVVRQAVRQVATARLAIASKAGAGRA